MANALVIGIGGVGSVIGMKLHEYDCFERIVLADIETTFAESLRQRTKNSRFTVVQANAADTNKLVDVLKEHEVTVTLNACPWVVNHAVLEACYQAGSHYLDMAADIYSRRASSDPARTRSRRRSSGSIMPSWKRTWRASFAWEWTLAQ